MSNGQTQNVRVENDFFTNSALTGISTAIWELNMTLAKRLKYEKQVLALSRIHEACIVYLHEFFITDGFTQFRSKETKKAVRGLRLLGEGLCRRAVGKGVFSFAEGAVFIKGNRGFYESGNFCNQ